MMSGSTIIFYLLGAFTLLSGFLAVTTKHIFRAAIFLLFSLIAIAGIYFWLNYEFIAAVQIVVYVGGIVVLIIFSIFLTQKSGEKLPAQKPGRIMASALACGIGFALSIVQIFGYSFKGNQEHPAELTVSNIGRQMLGTNDQGYALPFEVVSVLLLAAMIACIVIAMRSRMEKDQISQIK
jgi:NADH-quinone oxidoreductase subunit J